SETTFAPHDARENRGSAMWSAIRARKLSRDSTGCSGREFGCCNCHAFANPGVNEPTRITARHFCKDTIGLSIKLSKGPILEQGRHAPLFGTVSHTARRTTLPGPAGRRAFPVRLCVRRRSRILHQLV